MDLRKVEIYSECSWCEVDFADLTPGDVFRMFDSPEELVIDMKDGSTYWKCASHPEWTGSPDGEVLYVKTEKVVL